MHLICVAVWNRAVQLKVEYYMSRNIIIGKPELLEWNPESRLNSVQAIHDNVCNIVKDSVGWYQEAVVGRRRRAKCLRIFVIVIGQQVFCVEKAPAGLSKAFRRLLFAKAINIDALFANAGSESCEVAVRRNQAEAVETSAVQQVHRIND